MYNNRNYKGVLHLKVNYISEMIKIASCIRNCGMQHVCAIGILRFAAVEIAAAGRCVLRGANRGPRVFVRK